MDFLIIFQSNKFSDFIPVGFSQWIHAFLTFGDCFHCCSSRLKVRVMLFMSLEIADFPAGVSDVSDLTGLCFLIFSLFPAGRPRK